ncbi:MAG: DUF3822 family protein, partial [Flavobacteriaceae bacterium]
MTTEANTNATKRLSIRLSQDGFSFWIIDKQSNLLQSYGESSTKQDIDVNENHLIEQLTQTLLSFKEEADAVSLIYTTEIVLVHQSVFDQTQLQSYFQLSASTPESELTFLTDDFERNYIFK